MTLVAGLCYTFSTAVMPNLADADDSTFVATMQRFNDNPVFQLTFSAALVLTPLAAILQRRHGPGIAVRWTVAAFMLYVAALAVTSGLHIPLNNDIDQADPDRIAGLAQVRDDVEGLWVAWNIPRTLLTTAAVAALGWALLLHGRSTAHAEGRSECPGQLGRRPLARSLPPHPHPPHPARRESVR